MKIRCCHLGMAVAISVLTVFSAQAENAGILKRLDRIKALADDICIITNIVVRSGVASREADPSALWKAMLEEPEKAKKAFVRVDFVLKPEKDSDIRCRAQLPFPNRWDGRMWGEGNSGHAGRIPSVDLYTKAGSAAVTTDLGTWMITDCGRTNLKIWPENVRRDYDWRATHLMTVYGKKIVKAFYGRPCDKAYFNGGSCGGRQAMSEAIRFPEDYDGIIAALPANVSAVNEIASWHLWRQTHDAQGKAIFTTDEMSVVSDAVVDFRAPDEPAPFAGHTVSDGRLSPEDIDGALALAAKRCPSLKKGDKLARLRSLFLPLVHEGRCYFNGFAPGSYLGKNMSMMGRTKLRSYLGSVGIGPSRWKDVGWKEIDGFIKEYSAQANACSDDLSAFRKRGGKIIMSTGWEDQTIPPAPIVDFYERVCEKDGGIEKTLSYFRFFCVPGCAHGGGKGRLMSAAPGGDEVRQLIIDWREKNIAPDRISANWRSKKMDFPVAVYPGVLVHDAEGGWYRKETPRGGVARIHASCLSTDRTLPLSAKDGNAIRSAIGPYIARGEIAGIVSVISDPSGRVKTDCFGWADVENRRPMTDDTLFAIFSMTKTFTGAAIMAAIDEGKISLDDKVSKYLPEFRNIKCAKGPLKRELTIRDLMCHVSGGRGGYQIVARDIPLREVARKYAAAKFKEQPGDTFSYGNSSIDSAAAALEVAVGEPFEKWLDRKILVPLGMKDTTFFPDGGQIKRLVKAYTTKGGPFRPAADNCARQLEFPRKKKVYACAAAGLFSTPRDMIRFSRMLAGHGSFEGKTIISRKTFDGIFAVKQTPSGIKQQYTVGSWLEGDWFGHEGAMRTDQRANLKTGHARVFFIQTENKAGKAFFSAKRDWHAAADKMQGTVYPVK